VVFHDETSSAESFLRSQGAIWSAVNDPGGSIAESYGVTDPPTTFLIDPSGRISVNPDIGPATEQNLDDLLHAARAQGRRAARG
jgi:peroxiredoxin